MNVAKKLAWIFAGTIATLVVVRWLPEQVKAQLRF